MDLSQRQLYLKHWRTKNKEKIKQNANQYYIKNKDDMLKRMKINRKKNKTKYALTRKKWEENNKKYLAQKNKEWYEKNKEEYNKNRREQYQLNPPVWSTYQHRKEYLKKWQRQKRRKDLLYKLNSNISRRIRKDITRFNTTKKESTQNILSYSMLDLKVHIEQQFTKEMSWKNIGVIWEIDHITPVSWATTEYDLYQLWDLSNLRPMIKKDNREKSNLFSGDINTAFSLIGR